MRRLASRSGCARCRSELAREQGVADRDSSFASKLAPAGAVLVLMLSLPVQGEDLGAAGRDALAAAYYDFEVAGYCGLVSDAVGAGFRRRVARIIGEARVEQATLDRLRGEAWQAAHAEWQNRGLGGFRGWCRNEGRAAAQGFLAEPD